MDQRDLTANGGHHYFITNDNDFNSFVEVDNRNNLMIYAYSEYFDPVLNEQVTSRLYDLTTAGKVLLPQGSALYNVWVMNTHSTENTTLVLAAAGANFLCLAFASILYWLI